MADGLAERMKGYEGAEVGRRLMPLLPVLARLDGRAFHTFVRGLSKPFDQRLSNLMIDTLAFLVRETNATVGYTQSDELTLAWVPAGADPQVFFDGRVQKMTSTLAALCSVRFNRRLAAFLPAEYADRAPVFDCRVWNVPTLEEAAKCSRGASWTRRRTRSRWRPELTTTTRPYTVAPAPNCKSCFSERV